MSPVRIYHNILDVVDNKVGQETANLFDFSVVFGFAAGITSLFFKSFNEPIDATTGTVSLIVFFSTITAIRNLNNKYRREDIKQIINASVGKKKNCLIIETPEWYSDLSMLQKIFISLAGDIRLRHLRFNLKVLVQTYALKHLFAFSSQQLHTDLNLFKDKTFDMLWLRGHGSSEGFVMNNEFFLGSNDQAIIQSMAKKISGQACIVLSACNVGKGPINFAKTLSSFIPNTSIYAPADDLDGSYGTDFLEPLRPRFFNGKGLIETCTYRNGDKVL